MQDILIVLRNYPNLLEAVGIMGVVIYIGGFFLLQAGFLCGNGIAFSTSKVVAALCVLMSLVGSFNLASFLIQISFVTIGLFGLIRRCMSKYRPRNKSFFPVHPENGSMNSPYQWARPRNEDRYV